MEFEQNRFYQKENNFSLLKENFLIHFGFKPGLYDKFSSVDLIIDSKYNYHLFLFFYENNIPEEEIEHIKSAKDVRTFLHQNSKLPFEIRKKTKLIFENELFLKRVYYNDKNVFGILDRNEKCIKLNHKNGYFNIDLTIDTLNENLFEQNDEFQFLEFTTSLEKWVNKLRDNLMEPYEK